MADPSKINSIVLFKGKKVSTEKIDERILELLGLQDEYELSYEEYIGYLREAMVASRMSKSKYSTAETESITNEWKRVKSKKGRFRPKKISAESFKKGSATGINLNKQKALTGTKPLALPPATNKMAGGNEIATIIDALGEIIKSLTQQNKDAKKASELDRKSAEQKTRGEKESRLEKGVGLIAKAAEKILAPFKSILSRIIDFITAVFFGRLMIKLLRWFSDPENQKKFQSILRFLGDHWPTLLALYLRFGTGIGKLVGTLSSILIKGGLRLAAAAAGLLAKAGAGKAGKFAKFLGGRNGKLLGAGLEVAATVGTTMALSSGIESIGKDKPKVEGRAGGGSIRIPKFAGGGLNFGGFGNMFSGLVSGQKGVDKIPAMLSDGEFVMSRGAVQKYGVDTLEGMNAAGGGTNKPRMVSGTTYAAGGGYVGTDKPPKDNKLGKPTYGPGAMPNMSTQEDMKKLANKITFEERLKRIEAQVQSQKALASGKGFNVKGAQLGTQIGKGFGATYKGRDSIVVPNAAMTGWEQEITLGGKRYFGQVRGKDVIYTSHFAKGLAGQVDKYGAANKSYKGKGGGLMGGGGLDKIDPKGLPKTQVMTGPDGKVFVGHLRFREGKPEYTRPQQRQKGLMENIGNFFNPGGAKKREDNLNNKSKREAAMNSLQYYRASGMSGENIAKQMKKLGLNLTQAQNDLKYKDKETKDKSLIRDRSGNVIGQRDSKGREIMSKKAPTPPSKSDIIHKNIEIAKRQSQLKKTAPAPPTPPKTRFVNPSQGGAKTKSQLVGGGGKPSAPKFSASHPAGHSKTAKVLGIK
jgi:hypothetical protein